MRDGMVVRDRGFEKIAGTGESPPRGKSEILIAEREEFGVIWQVRGIRPCGSRAADSVSRQHR